jgi:hypothetical protein
MPSKNWKIKINKIIILLLVLYGCETWSLTVGENRQLRKICGRKTEKVTGGWRKLHNEKLHNLYSSLHTILCPVLPLSTTP